MSNIITRLRSRAFWVDALERGFGNAWQAIAALALVAPGMTLVDVDWYTLTGIGLASGAASVLLSIIALPAPGADIPVWQAVVVRAVRTFLTVLAAVLGAGAVNVFELDWPHVLSAAAVATLLALMKNTTTPPIESVPTLTATYVGGSGPS